MDAPTGIEFKVDGEYENEKGVFKVISMDRDQMVIRWKSGEETTTDIALQRRIAERREWERLNALAKAQAALKSSARSKSARKKAEFSGFGVKDFKKSASGTTWRSRNQLGSRVAQQIDTARFAFNSWAFGHKPEMHLQDIKHRSRKEPDYQAKFFVRVDKNSLYYGFRVARPENSSGASSDWDAFMGWLSQQDNEEDLREIAAKNQLTCSLANPSLKSLVALDDGWSTDEGGEKGKTSLVEQINKAPETKALNLEFSAAMDKGDAIALGGDIAANISGLLTRLLPLYRSAVSG